MTPTGLPTDRPPPTGLGWVGSVPTDRPILGPRRDDKFQINFAPPSRGVGYAIVTGRGGGKVQKGTLGIRVGYKVTPELAPLLKLKLRGVTVRLG